MMSARSPQDIPRPGPTRRALLSAGGASALLALADLVGPLARSAAAAGNPTPFSRQQLVDQARKMAASDFAAPKFDLPERFANLSFEQYNDIRFRPDRFIWRSEGRGFALSLLHTGSVFRQPVDIFIVEDGNAHEIDFSRDMFDYGPNIKPPDEKQDLAFSGLKIRRPLAAPDRFDEVVSFQGATYFKALAKGTRYGVSARGLAINLSEEGAEEFPFFRAFYVERPDAGASSVVVHALLDSPSCAGAYRFTIRAEDTTTVDVELTIFPRKEMANVGLGPLSSMFLYDATARTRFDDMRPAVHASDGLAIRTGGGEAIFRPLANPRNLQISAFVDQNPRGFGLIQRRRGFEEFEDLDNRYDLRPSAWVEPIGDWGEGAVNLVEIPSDSEIHDNIVAFWRPKAKLPAKEEFSLAYRMTWAPNPPQGTEIGRAFGTRIGTGKAEGSRRFVIDFRGTMPPAQQIKLDATTSAGKLVNAQVRPNPVKGGYRVTFDLDVRNIQLAELRVLLTDGTKPVTETWLYRWTA